MDKVTRHAVRYVAEFVDVMHEALTMCCAEEERFRAAREEFDGYPGRFIEDIMEDVERLSKEKGQVAVWVAYALYDFVSVATDEQKVLG